METSTRAAVICAAVWRAVRIWRALRVLCSAVAGDASRDQSGLGTNAHQASAQHARIRHRLQLRLLVSNEALGCAADAIARRGSGGGVELSRCGFAGEADCQQI